MAKLTYKHRKELSKKSFVFPNKAPDPGSYPIDTVGRARAALRYGARFANPSEYATIKRKVYARYPELKKRKSLREHRRTK